MADINKFINKSDAWSINKSINGGINYRNRNVHQLHARNLRTKSSGIVTRNSNIAVVRHHTPLPMGNVNLQNEDNSGRIKLPYRNNALFNKTEIFPNIQDTPQFRSMIVAESPKAQRVETTPVSPKR